MTDYVPPDDVPVWCCACGESFDVPDLRFAPYPLDNGICHECWRLIRRPNHAIVAENRRLREENERLREVLRETAQWIDYMERPGPLAQASRRAIAAALDAR